MERAEAIALATAGFDVRIGRSIEDALALPILRDASAASARLRRNPSADRSPPDQ
jgi:hypothetical protein